MAKKELIVFKLQQNKIEPLVLPTLVITIRCIEEECKPVVVGIDFGTMNSGIGWALKAATPSIKFGASTVRDETQY